MAAIGEPYVTLSELKGYMGVPMDDTADDAVMTWALATISAGIEHHCRRQFGRAEEATTRTYDVRHPYRLDVHDFYTTEGLEVAILDGESRTVVDPSGYRLLPRDGIVDGVPGWPFSRVRLLRGLRVAAEAQMTTRWGWEAVPDPVRSACLILSSELSKAKDAPFGVAGYGEYGAIRVRQNPLAAGMLVPYRRRPVLVG